MGTQRCVPLLLLLACLAQPAQPRPGLGEVAQPLLPTRPPRPSPPLSAGSPACFVAAPAGPGMGHKPGGAAGRAIATQPRVLVRRLVAAGRMQAGAGNMGSTGGGGEDLNPTKLLEQMRRQQQKVGWAEKLASSFAPRSSAEEFKLNWVGNIDRHQRKLFWRLITLLCDRIDPYLRWMRIAHDIIQAAKARALATLAFTMCTIFPTVRAAGLAFARQALMVSREMGVLARLLFLRVCAQVGKSALSLVGVGVAMPPRHTGHAAEHSVGPAAGSWQRKVLARLRLLDVEAARTGHAYACSGGKVVRPSSASVRQEAPQFANTLLRHPEADSALFPAEAPPQSPAPARYLSSMEGTVGRAGSAGKSVKGQGSQTRAEAAADSARAGKDRSSPLRRASLRFGGFVQAVRSFDIII